VDKVGDRAVGTPHVVVGELVLVLVERHLREGAIEVLGAHPEGDAWKAKHKHVDQCEDAGEARHDDALEQRRGGVDTRALGVVALAELLALDHEPERTGEVVVGHLADGEGPLVLALPDRVDRSAVELAGVLDGADRGSLHPVLTISED